MFANEDTTTSERRHPFWYARACGIYKVNVFYGRILVRAAVRN